MKQRCSVMLLAIFTVSQLWSPVWPSSPPQFSHLCWVLRAKPTYGVLVSSWCGIRAARCLLGSAIHCVCTYQVRSCSSLNIRLKPLVKLVWLGQAYSRWFYLPTVFQKNWIKSSGPNSYLHKGHIACQEHQFYLPNLKKKKITWFFQIKGILHFFLCFEKSFLILLPSFCFGSFLSAIMSSSKCRVVCYVSGVILGRWYV